MLERLALFTVRRGRLVLVATVALLAVAAVVGAGVAQRLSNGGFTTSSAESSRAEVVLAERFGAAPPNLVLLVTAPAGVDSPAVAAVGLALTEEVRTSAGVSSAVSYWSADRAPALRTDDGTAALVAVRLAGDEDEIRQTVLALAPGLEGERDGVTVEVGGSAAIFAEVGETIESDLLRAESIAVPLTFLALVLIFGSLVASLLPLAIGAVSVLGTLAVLSVLAEVTPVSVFALNLTTALGLGLAIDYSLFLVSRHREELARGRSVADAVVATVLTAGRTVLFSALTVLLSLSAMLVFPLYFLRSFAYAGIVVVALAAVGALVVLPALLAVLGHRVDSLDLRRPLRRLLRLPPPAPRTPTAASEGMWHRLAVGVMRRPVGIGLGVVALLLLLGAPFLGVRFGLPDDRVLPASAATSQVGQALREDFDSQETLALSVVAPETGTVDPAVVADYATRLSSLPGVLRVDALSGVYAQGQVVAGPDAASARFLAPTGGGTYLTVVPAVEANSPDGQDLVAAVRAVDAPWPVLVGGDSAALADTLDALADKLPLAGALVGITTLVLLFLFTGSVLIPVKAVVLNLLSLSATFGAMVWIFQDGNLAGLLGSFQVTGTLDATTPILMFCVLFGLSMDYEVFLLSRIKEAHDEGHDTASAVPLGLERTGPIVTAAAALLAIVFLSFATSSITFIKLLGLGTALAVLVDATLVRGALVPAFMRLAGDANWWAPRPLRWVHDRFGLSEAAPPPLPPGSEVATPARVPESAGV